MQLELINLPKIFNSQGNLSFIEEDTHLPFKIKRVYWIYDIPEDSCRGGHAHKTLYQLIIAVNGIFDVIIDDGTIIKAVKLDKPDLGLLIEPGIWREIKNFSKGAICLVLASEKYNENDYLRNYPDFIKYKNDTSNC